MRVSISLLVVAINLLIGCSWQDDGQELQVLCHSQWTGTMATDSRTISISGNGYKTIGIAPGSEISARISSSDKLDTLSLRIISFVNTGGIKVAQVTKKITNCDTAFIQNF